MPGSPADFDRVTVLADELAELSRRLDRARGEVLSWRAQPAPPADGRAQQAPPAAWYPPPAGPPMPPPRPVPPPPAGPPPAGPPIPPTTRAGGDGLLSGRVLAWTGGSITLVGVVLFLALAIRRGWFGVPAQLIVGGLFGATLVGLGCWLHRRPEGRTGALALVGTGIAALYLDVGTATAKYHYLPDVLGLLLGLTVAGAGLALADRWRARLLGVGTLLGIGVFLPAVTSGSMPLLVALVLVPQLAAAPVWTRRGWTPLAVIGAAFPILYAMITVFGAAFDAGGPEATATAAVIAVFVVGAALALVGVRRLPAPTAAALLAAAPVPALGMAAVYEGRTGALLAGLVGLALLAVGLPARLSELSRPELDELPGLVRLVAATAGAVAIFQATALALDGAALTYVLLGQALVLAVLAGFAGRRAALLVSACYGVAGIALAARRDAPVWALAEFPAEPYLRIGQPDYPALITGLSVSALVVALAIGSVLAADRLGLARPDAATAWLWAPAGAVGLYGAAGVVITSALLVAPAQPGFVAGHALVTISWMAGALVLLARGIARPALRVTGLVLVAAAVAKLIFFDLIALDGLARVAAFVGAGLLLLAAGSRYAWLVARD